MREWQSQAHVKRYCRYHVVTVPKYRRKAMLGTIRRDMGQILSEVCRRFEVELVEGHVVPAVCESGSACCWAAACQAAYTSRATVAQ
jgi:hypothetical protein